MVFCPNAYIMEFGFAFNSSVLVAANNTVKVQLEYYQWKGSMLHIMCDSQSCVLLFCRFVTLVLQSSVISSEELVSTLPPRSLELQGGWLQRYGTPVILSIPFKWWKFQNCLWHGLTRGSRKLAPVVTCNLSVPFSCYLFCRHCWVVASNACIILLRVPPLF